MIVTKCLLQLCFYFYYKELTMCKREIVAENSITGSKKEKINE
jgi:hypothetical protein